MSTPTPTQPFEPREHLIQLKSKTGAQDYLPVAWRLVWFREAYPQGTITTEILHLDLAAETEEETTVWDPTQRKSVKHIKRAKGVAVVKATVHTGAGGAATGVKKETGAGFPDYLEKAETGSIGRALAALGFGTQFAPELDEGAERLGADSPGEAAGGAKGGAQAQKPPQKHVSPHVERVNKVYVVARDSGWFTPRAGSEQADFLAWVRTIFPTATIRSISDINETMLRHLEGQPPLAPQDQASGAPTKEEPTPHEAAAAAAAA